MTAFDVTWNCMVWDRLCQFCPTVTAWTSVTGAVVAVSGVLTVSVGDVLAYKRCDVEGCTVH